jgi:hypothetical protein
MDRDAGSLTPEARVLVALGTPDVPPAAAAAIVDHSRHVSWTAVVDAAAAEGIAGLASRHLASSPALAAAVPAGAAERLKTIHAHQWARNTVLATRWSEATRAMSAAGVSVITLKGMALVHEVYRDFGVRPMADIDLLVRPRDAPRAIDALLALGYHHGDAALCDEQDGRSFRQLARDGTVIDLHWHLGRYPRVESAVRLDHDALWDGARRLTASSLALSREHLLLHLAYHLTFGSEFGRLVWFTDIAAAVDAWNETIAWPALVADARRWGLAGATHYALAAARLLGAAVPAGVLAALAPSPARRAVRDACLGGLTAPSIRGGLPTWRIYLAETVLVDDVADVARVLAWTAFPSAAWLRAHYGTQSRWGLRAWRAMHPFRVAWLAARQSR